MKLSKPPALATWLVEHSTRGSKGEALAGDLLEQFSEGRSVAWYWRQALVATLVGFRKEWFILVQAAVVTTFCAIYVNHAHYWSSLSARSFSHSLIVFSYALAIHTPLMLARYGVAVGLPTKEKRRIGWLFIGRPLLRGYLAVVPSTFLLLALVPAQRHPVLVGNIVSSLPAFFAMVVVMWSEPDSWILWQESALRFCRSHTAREIEERLQRDQNFRKALDSLGPMDGEDLSRPHHRS